MGRSTNKRSGSHTDNTNVDSDDSVSSINGRKRKNIDSHDEILHLLQTWKIEQDEKYRELSASIDELKKQNTIILATNNQIQESLKFFYQEQNSIKEKVDELSKGSIEAMLKIGHIEEQIDTIQKKERQAMILINNIPVTKQIDPPNIVEKLHKLLKLEEVNLEVKQIYVINKKDKNTIIVKYKNIEQKRRILKEIKKFNKTNNEKLHTEHLSIDQVKSPVYVSDYLTQKTKKIFDEARNLKKTGKVKHCWISNGKVLVRKTDDGPTTYLKTLSEVLSIHDLSE